MCYSAMLKQDAKKLGLNFNARIQVDGIEFFNIRVFPHNPFPVVLSENGENVIKMFNYSLVPYWSKERKPKFATYNARVESVCTKASWKEPIKNQRCLVAMTSFFESCREGTHAGNMVEFYSKNNNEILTAAGVWDEWKDPDSGEILRSFAIITTKPSAFIQNTGHDRSPLFLPPDAAQTWLGDDEWRCAKASTFLLENATEPALDVKIERPLKKVL